MKSFMVGNYRLTKKIIKGIPKKGVPELWQAEDLGDIYYAKIWRKTHANNSAIQALWNREIRSLTRIHGYPGASELFVKLRDIDSDDKYFFAILDGGRKEILSRVLENRIRYSWLSNLSEVARRQPLWQGLRRIAEGLALLHREGTLHRALSTEAIFINPEGDGEFQLSGFEWSLRLSGPDNGASKVENQNVFMAPELRGSVAEYSTATDWYSFGIIAAELFGVPLRNLKNSDAIPEIIQRMTTLRKNEKKFISRLLTKDQNERLVDSDEILQSLQRIISDIDNMSTSSNKNLVMAVRLGHGLEFSRIIEIVSERNARADDPISQREWINKDLKGDIRVVGRSTPFQHYVLKGNKLEYRVRSWSVDGATMWDVGFCDGIERVPKIINEDQVFSVGQRQIVVQLFPHVRKNLRSVRDRAARWDKVFPFRQEKVKLPRHLQIAADFFRITQQLDTVLTISQICAVEILKITKGTNDTEIVLTPISDPERNDLAHFLNLTPPHEQMKDWFKLGAETIAVDDEEEPKKDSYSLLNGRTITSEISSASWTFEDAVYHPKGPHYTFRSPGSVVIQKGRAYLARNHSGTLAQIRRRNKAVENMRLFEGLLQFISSPSEASHANSDELPPNKTSIKLDTSKISILHKVWKIQPGFAIQGPPGTGKTTLIKAFVDRLLNYDSTAQVLITAHSHHTVDDVRRKISQIFSGLESHERPIIIRLGNNNDEEHSPECVTASLVQNFLASDLVKRAPEYLVNRLSSLSDDYRELTSSFNDFSTIQLLVQDAANLTFSTLNSQNLEDLASRGRRFDWSIIEEAGKAHGFDMATALQESHRLLLIGDHHQLPPFNAQRFIDLLNNPLSVKKAIQKGAQFAPGLVDPSLVDDNGDPESFGEQCRDWAHMVTLFGSIFSRSMDDETDNCPAATLTHQHRMHPDIAELVGRVFYPDGKGGTILHSPEETCLYFQGKPPFSIPKESWLPHQSIVWCDTNWQQKEEFSEGEIEGLFVSKPEAEIVADILEQIYPNSSCSLQILSPYNNQLKEIRKCIERRHRDGRLEHMFSPPFDLKLGKRMGATVDEFQGSEADVVIVSLVRNNALVPWKSLGFLKESSRMNVLLSRARHKLIIVGSWDFFDSRCGSDTSEYDDYAYIGDMMNEMKRAARENKLSLVRSKK